MGGEWHSAVICTSVATLPRNEEKDCRVICKQSEYLAPRGKGRAEGPVLLFCVMETLFATRPSDFVWFLNRMTFIVDSMLAKCQVYSNEFESVDITACVCFLSDHSSSNRVLFSGFHWLFSHRVDTGLISIWNL